MILNRFLYLGTVSLSHITVNKRFTIIDIAKDTPPWIRSRFTCSTNLCFCCSRSFTLALQQRNQTDEYCSSYYLLSADINSNCWHKTGNWHECVQYCCPINEYGYLSISIWCEQSSFILLIASFTSWTFLSWSCSRSAFNLITLNKSYKRYFTRYSNLLEGGWKERQGEKSGSGKRDGRRKSKREIERGEEIGRQEGEKKQWEEKRKGRRKS